MSLKEIIKLAGGDSEKLRALLKEEDRKFRQSFFRDSTRNIETAPVKENKEVFLPKPV
jgi:hypothetical protein